MTWRQQANLSGNITPTLVPISHSEFITVPYTHNANVPSECYIQKYNSVTNKWTRLIKYSSNLQTSCNSVAFNKYTQEIYLFGIYPKLIKIHLKTKQIKIIQTNKSFGALPMSIIIDGTYHIIGGTQNNKHLIWNDDTEQFTEIYTFENWSTGLIFGSLIYIERKKMLLLFGGIDCATQSESLPQDSIYIYYINEQKWELLDIELELPLYAFGCVLTKDQKYVILLGGAKTNEIHIFNTDNMLFEDDMWSCDEVMPYCPFIGQCIGTMSANRSYVLIIGYIRCYFGKLLPSEIIELIELWYSINYIHLIEFGENGTHWKIDVNEIIST
eukprot:347847_1